MQRLFSTFPGGLPGVGLLLQRVVIATPLIHAGLLTASSPAPVVSEILAAVAAILLLIGLWTPVAGSVIALAEFRLAFTHPEYPWPFIYVGVLGAAVAMLGPGGCSVDARLFGRKRIQIPRQ